MARVRLDKSIVNPLRGITSQHFTHAPICISFSSYRLKKEDCSLVAHLLNTGHDNNGREIVFVERETPSLLKVLEQNSETQTSGTTLVSVEPH